VTTLTEALRERYRIERELGAGGMATVYLAQDLKHDRKVAIKVLRPELAAVIGAERFLIEIRTTANLQHPHILPLFDSGEAGNRDTGEGTFLYYVMPYVEGETVRDRLTREKQLPVAEAVRIATEVAGALDYAHRHNVIHRDIKPENILLHDGRALVADFGIALAASKAGGTRMTETGMSLGTPHYMSPEQAMGERKITARSDVYALGCVLFEMLTGDPPFTGSTAQAIVAKVMTDEPAAPSRHRKAIPGHVDHAVLTALEKLPADRWGSASELAQALAGIGMTGRTQSRRAAPDRSVRSGRNLMTALGVTLFLMTLLAAWGWARSRSVAPTAGVMRFVVMLPASQQIAEAPDHLIAMAPDGAPPRGRPRRS
jgi:serine/threonine-protein kinase